MNYDEGSDFVYWGGASIAINDDFHLYLHLSIHNQCYSCSSEG
jgi:hypothetical protein